MVDLEKLDELCEAATAGPWYDCYGGEPLCIGSHTPISQVADAEIEWDAAFIAAARQAVPELVAEVRELRTALSRMVATGYDLVDVPKEADDA